MAHPFINFGSRNSHNKANKIKWPSTAFSANLETKVESFFSPLGKNSARIKYEKYYSVMTLSPLLRGQNLFLPISCVKLLCSKRCNSGINRTDDSQSDCKDNQCFKIVCHRLWSFAHYIASTLKPSWLSLTVLTIHAFTELLSVQDVHFVRQI